MLVDFVLPGSTYEWKNFYIREVEGGQVIVSTPNSLHGRWSNPCYPWNVLCKMLKEEYQRFKENSSIAEKLEDSSSMCIVQSRKRENRGKHAL